MKYRVIRDKGVDVNGKHYAHGKLVEVELPEIPDLEPLPENPKPKQKAAHEAAKRAQIAAKAERERVQEMIEPGLYLEPRGKDADEAPAEPAKKKAGKSAEKEG